MPDSNLSAVVEIICRVGDVPEVEPDQDFYEAGCSSFIVLPLLTEMEERFQVRIPDDRFLQARTARALDELITSLKEG